MNFIEWVQRRLMAHGFDPGIVDGIWGRNTHSAVVAFQRSRGLQVTGALNEGTMAALRQGWAGGPAGPDHPPRHALDVFPWMELGLRKKGLHEKRDNAALRAFLSSDGRTLGDPAIHPWCGDFVETCIAVAVPGAVLPSNPYLARNWLSFGQGVHPCFGSILVFWRKKLAGIEGHVGFYYAEDPECFHVLGGNQSDAILISRILKTRLLGARLPTVGGPFPRKIIRSAADWDVSIDEA